MNEATGTALDVDTAMSSITTALGEVLKVDPQTLSGTTRLFDDLGLDSTTVLEVLMQIEEELGVEFDSDTLEHHHFESVSTLAQYVVETA